MTRRFFLLAGCLLVGLATACNQQPASNKPTPKTGDSPADKPSATEPGEPLFKPTAFEPMPDRPRAQVDPIVISLAHLTVKDKEDVPSQLDGVVGFIGVEVSDVEAAKLPARDIYKHPRTGKLYRRLHHGDKVAKDQTVALLDDVLANLQVKISELAVQNAKADVQAAAAMIISVKALEDIQRKAWNAGGSGSLLDLRSAEATTQRYVAERVAKEAAQQKVEGERDQAALKLTYHTIATTIAGEVTQIYRERGEAIKANENLLQIQNLDRLRVEGFLGLEHNRRVEKGMTVIVEPAIPLDADVVYSFHKSLPITALAISAHGPEPLILSGGQEGTVNVWDRSKKTEMSWSQKGAVRAIACTTRGAADALALTGGDDGIARIYDLNKLAEKPLRELVEKTGDTQPARHSAGVQAAAFSPDGQFCVTADGERNIYLWKTRTGEKLYRFPAEHTSPVSALHFLPQCRVLSVGRDNVVHVWKVGDKGAEIERSFEHRSGDVPQLGVTEDGNWLMLDHDKSRLQAINLGKGLADRVLRSTGGESSQFSNFAIVSPPLDKGGNRLLLTAAGNGSVVQLWRRAPNNEERIREIRRLVVDGNAPATVAAFSPPGVEKGFIIVGTQRGEVHLWAIPPQVELDRQWTGTVVNKDSAAEPTGRSIRLWVELDNDPEGPYRLKPGTAATIVIQPK
jgi:WD40 repeat protein/biotin carboxyl carrier protein